MTIKCILKYFIGFDAVVNGIVLLISLSDSYWYIPGLEWHLWHGQVGGWKGKLGGGANAESLSGPGEDAVPSRGWVRSDQIFFWTMTLDTV